MKRLYILLLAGLLITTITDISAQTTPCTLMGGSVYIDNSTNPSMMNATVNGMSQYNYSWIDTNSVVVGTANQIPFYTQWCVTITDLVTGCDTTICQDCTAGTAVCMCTMIYMPVCGCDGVMYGNYCLADCADVSWTPAISNGMPGGWLPCTQPSSCEVEISGDSILCSLGSPQILTAVPAGNGTPPYTYSWSNGQSNSPILTIIAPGTYCVTVTDANGCVDSACFTVAIEEIVIYSTPSPPIICLGDTISLEFWNTPLTNIVWTPTGDTTHMIHDNPNISTTYIVEGIDVNGCERRGEVFVQVDSCNNGPCAIPFLEVEHDTITNMLEANQISSNFSYQWTNGDTTYNTSYYANWCLYVVDLNGCDTTICDITTSLFENIESNIKIYPNPTRSNMIFELPQGEKFNLQVFDIRGQVVLSKEKVMNKFMIDNNYLSNGTYIMQLIHNSGLITEKIIFE